MTRSVTQNLATLNLPQNATRAQMEHAYEKLSRKLRPDKNVAATPQQAKENAANFQLISDARDALRGHFDAVAKQARASDSPVDGAFVHRQGGGAEGVRTGPRPRTASGSRAAEPSAEKAGESQTITREQMQTFDTILRRHLGRLKDPQTGKRVTIDSSTVRDVRYGIMGADVEAGRTPEQIETKVHKLLQKKQARLETKKQENPHDPLLQHYETSVAHLSAFSDALARWRHVTHPEGSAQTGPQPKPESKPRPSEASAKESSAKASSAKDAGEPGRPVEPEQLHTFDVLLRRHLGRRKDPETGKSLKLDTGYLQDVRYGIIGRDIENGRSPQQVETRIRGLLQKRQERLATQKKTNPHDPGLKQAEARVDQLGAFCDALTHWRRIIKR